jgi:hypothetical protein
MLLEDAAAASAYEDDIKPARRKKAKSKPADELAALEGKSADSGGGGGGGSGADGTKRRKPIGEDSDDERETIGSLVVSGRDEMFSIFRSLGKILRAKDEYSAEFVVERGGLPPSLFAEWMHENYIDFLPLNDIESIDEAAHFLSDADLFGTASRASSYGNVRSIARPCLLSLIDGLLTRVSVCSCVY